MTRTQKIVVGFLLGTPCFCCVGGLGYVQFKINAAGEGLGAEITKAKGMGMPVVPADLARSLRTSENAAPDYLAAMALAPDKSKAEKDLSALSPVMGTTRPATPEATAKAAAAYKALAPLIPIIERAADKPHCDFRKDFKQGFRLLFPEFAPMKSYVRLMVYKARVQGQQGDLKGALKSIARAQSISRHAGESPSIIGMLVQISGESITHNALRELVRTNRDNRPFLDDALRTAQGFGPLPNFYHAMGGELVLGRVAIRQVRTLGEINGSQQETSSDGLQSMVLGNRSVQNAFDKKLLEAYNYMMPMIPKDGQDWEKAVEASSKLEVRLADDDSPFGMMNQVLFPVFSQAGIAIGRTQAQRNVTETGINLLRAKLSTGAFPKALPANPVSLDPFTKKPLIYKPTAAGFLVYSLDQDKIDNGGTPSKTNSERDIAFKVP